MTQDFYPVVQQYVDERISEFGLITENRQRDLIKITEYVLVCRRANLPVNLTFICTHNSRRSQFSQIWAAVAVDFYGVGQVDTYSGGTEATAVALPLIASLERAGFKFTKSGSAENPHFGIHYADSGRVLDCFSKVFNEPPNPNWEYCAIMTCSQADTNCPIVQGALTRLALPYDDPKVSDGRSDEAATYDERCRQIAREMLYAFSQLDKL